MEETIFETKQARVKVEETDRIASHAEWGLEEPAPKRAKAFWEPTEEQLYFKERKWAPPTAVQKKSAELRSEYEKNRIIVNDGVVWHRMDWKTYDLFRGSFFDHRWFRSVYWDE